MSEHVTIMVRAHNTPSVLPRILLVFSRRRQRIQALQCYDLDREGPAEIQADLECDPRCATELVRQLERIVEVVDVRATRLPTSGSRRAQLDLAVAG